MNADKRIGFGLIRVNVRSCAATFLLLRGAPVFAKDPGGQVGGPAEGHP